MPAASWPSGDTITTSSGPIPRLATRPQQKHAERLSNLRAPRPARLPNPKPTTINPKDSRYERGTTGGQVILGPQFLEGPVAHPVDDYGRHGPQHNFQCALILELIVEIDD